MISSSAKMWPKKKLLSYKYFSAVCCTTKCFRFDKKIASRYLCFTCTLFGGRGAINSYTRYAVKNSSVPFSRLKLRKRSKSRFAQFLFFFEISVCDTDALANGGDDKRKEIQKINPEKEKGARVVPQCSFFFVFLSNAKHFPAVKRPQRNETLGEGVGWQRREKKKENCTNNTKARPTPA